MKSDSEKLHLPTVNHETEMMIFVAFFLITFAIDPVIGFVETLRRLPHSPFATIGGGFKAGVARGA